MNTYWHPFADMSVVKSHEIVMDGGEGAWVWDTAGRRYLDAGAALWYCNVGYGRDEIVDAVARQMRKLPTYSTFGVFATAPTLDLAERLGELAPIPGAAVFFTSGGSESVDSAAKLARRYWDLKGRPGKRIIISRQHGYHGMNAYGTSLAGIPGNLAGYGGPLIPDVENVTWNDVAALERLFEEGADRIAAVIGEPVIGAGGVYPPPEGYWSEVERLCRIHDVLLIADEVITGFGRTGWMFGAQRYGFQPDMVTFAKGVTSGYFPLGGVLVGERVRAPFWDGPPGTMFRHGYTYSGHASACAAAMANLDIIEREGLVDRVRSLEPVLARELGRLHGMPGVGEIRVVGLTAGVDFADDVLAAEPGIVDRAVIAAREHGVLTRTLRGRAFQISPPFVITEGEIRQMVDGLAAAVQTVVGTGAGVAAGR